MKSKRSLSVLFLAIAALILSGNPGWSQSVGETQNKRSGGDSQTPMGPAPGNVGPSGSSRSQSGSARSQEDNSVGGSQSQRSSDSQTPLPPGPGNVGKSSQPRSSTAQRGKDTSVGGTQSERSGGDSQTPLPQVGQPGTDDPARAQRSRSASAHRGMSGKQDVKEAQEALKSQGHDPGPIDGIMGSQTRQALREFQSQNGLKQTGMLDAETKQKLNIDDTSSAPSPSSSSRGDSMRQKQSR